MAAIDYTDFYILDKNFTKFNDIDLVEDDLIKIIIQKYQMIIFTRKGEVMGDPDFGGDLEEILYETRISDKDVRESLLVQIISYIPEVVTESYRLEVAFQEDTENFQDIMFIYFQISDYEIVNQIGGFS